MAEVTKTLPFEEAVKEIMSRVGCSEYRARLIAAIERGELNERNDYGHRIDPPARKKKKRPAA